MNDRKSEGEIHMNITTKYGIGNIVYAVHPCRIICNGKVIMSECAFDVDKSSSHIQPHGDDIYIVSPHEVKNVTVSCNGESETDIQYELSNGIIRREKDLFASFDDAARYAVMLYGQSAGECGGIGDTGRKGVLKEDVCRKLQQAMKTVLSFDQLERFEEEFLKATQGLVFKEA